MILKSYNTCVYCGSKKFVLSKKKFVKNFYIEAIKSDLNITDKVFKKMKVYKCNNCHILQNNPWFNDDDVFKIYSHIYFTIV